MTFAEVLAQTQELLRQQKRVSYRGLKRRFDLDDEYLEDLKEELIGALRLAADEEDRFLIPEARCPNSGSPKGLTPRICKRQRRCWRHCVIEGFPHR